MTDHNRTVVIHFNQLRNSEIGYDDEQYARLTNTQTQELIDKLIAAIGIAAPSEVEAIEILIVAEADEITTNQKPKENQPS